MYAPGKNTWLFYFLLIVLISSLNIPLEFKVTAKVEKNIIVIVPVALPLFSNINLTISVKNKHVPKCVIIIHQELHHNYSFQ